MDKRDKQLISSFVAGVTKVANDIGDQGAVEKDKETKAQYRRWTEDLHFLVNDIIDTLARL